MNFFIKLFLVMHLFAISLVAGDFDNKYSPKRLVKLPKGIIVSSKSHKNAPASSHEHETAFDASSFEPNWVHPPFIGPTSMAVIEDEGTKNKMSGDFEDFLIREFYNN